MRRASAAILIAGFTLTSACGGQSNSAATPPPAAKAPENVKKYEVIGQILVVSPDKQTISIKHQDIVGYMPAMTMTFPVAAPELMKDRVPGLSLIHI